MRRVVIGISLCLALASPFVVVARAAHGLSMTLADVGLNLLESAENAAEEDFDGIEFASVLTSFTSGVFDLSIQPLSPDPPVLFVLLPTSHPIGLATLHLRHGPSLWPPPGHSLRQALLQSYRF